MLNFDSFQVFKSLLSTQFHSIQFIKISISWWFSVDCCSHSFFWEREHETLRFQKTTTMTLTLIFGFMYVRMFCLGMGQQGLFWPIFTLGGLFSLKLIEHIRWLGILQVGSSSLSKISCLMSSFKF